MRNKRSWYRDPSKSSVADCELYEGQYCITFLIVRMGIPTSNLN